MATPIVIGLATYLQDFSGAQQSVPSPRTLLPGTGYVEYAIDLDTSLNTLRITMNAVITELDALGGGNAIFAQDILFIDESGAPPDTQTGRVGVAGFITTINASPVFLDITKGVMARSGIRILVGADQQVSAASLANGTYFANIDANGVITMSTLEDVAVASVDVLSNVFVTPLTDLLATFLDGDEWFNMQQEPANTPFNSTGLAVATAGAHVRLDNYSRYLGGFSTNTDDDAISAQIIGGGSASSPRIGLSNGTSTIDAGAGLYRSAASTLSFSAGSTERVRLNSSGLVLQVGSPSAPALSFINSTGTGLFLFESTPDELGFAVNGAIAAHLSDNGFEVQAIGTALLPSYSWVSDLDTGIYKPANNQVGITTGGTSAVIFNASQQRISATQGRFAATATGETHNSGTGTWDVVDVDSAHVIYDVGNYHAGGSPSTPTVPSGGDFDGNYSIKAWARFVAASTGQRGIRMSIGGTIIAETLVDATAGSTVVTVTCTADGDAVATNTIITEVFQSSGGDLNFDYRTSFRVED